MSFNKPDCRAFSHTAHNLALTFLSVLTLASLGVLLHSIWALSP